eukprot:5383785-Pleurochrysis_carterae.AAC.2
MATCRLKRRSSPRSCLRAAIYGPPLLPPTSHECRLSQAVRKVVDSALARLHADAAGAATLEELRRKQAEVWAEHPDAQQARTLLF